MRVHRSTNRSRLNRGYRKRKRLSLKGISCCSDSPMVTIASPLPLDLRPSPRYSFHPIYRLQVSRATAQARSIRLLHSPPRSQESPPLWAPTGLRATRIVPFQFPPPHPPYPQSSSKPLPVPPSTLH